METTVPDDDVDMTDVNVTADAQNDEMISDTAIPVKQGEVQYGIEDMEEGQAKEDYHGASEAVRDYGGGMQASDPQANLLIFRALDGDSTLSQAASAAMFAASSRSLSRAKDESLSRVDTQRDPFTQEIQQAFGSILNDLMLSFGMTSGSSDDANINRIVSALTNLAEFAPAQFQPGGHGAGKGVEEAIKFARETCLSAWRPSADKEPESEPGDDGENLWDKEKIAKETAKCGQSQTDTSDVLVSMSMTPDRTVSALEDESLSFTCRRISAAIEFLVAYIRYSQGTNSKAPDDLVEQIFDLLCQIIQDSGVPPSSQGAETIPFKDTLTVPSETVVCTRRRSLCSVDQSIKVKTRLLPLQRKSMMVDLWKECP
jgi:hypothetical protein